MKAITVELKKLGTARYEDFLEPDVHEGSVLVEAVAVGICENVETVEVKYGWAPPGKERLVQGLFRLVCSSFVVTILVTITGVSR